MKLNQDVCVSPLDICKVQSTHTLDLDHITKYHDYLMQLHRKEVDGATFDGYVDEAKLTGIICDKSLGKDIQLLDISFHPIDPRVPTHPLLI